MPAPALETAYLHPTILHRGKRAWLHISAAGTVASLHGRREAPYWAGAGPHSLAGWVGVASLNCETPSPLATPASGPRLTRILISEFCLCLFLSSPLHASASWRGMHMIIPSIVRSDTQLALASTYGGACRTTPNGFGLSRLKSSVVLTDFLEVGTVSPRQGSHTEAIRCGTGPIGI